MILYIVKSIFKRLPFDIYFIYLYARQFGLKAILESKNGINYQIYLSSKNIKNFEPELCGKIEANTRAINLKIPTNTATIFFDDINNLEQLLKPYRRRGKDVYIKQNNASQRNLYMRTQSINNDEIQMLKNKLASWEKYKFYKISGEKFYKYAKNGFIIEDVLGTKFALDLKIHCVNGKACWFQYIDRSSGKLVRATWLKRNGAWDREKTYIGECSEADVDIEIIEELSTYSESIAAHFPYARIDFLRDSEKNYLGEITYRPAAGVMPFIDTSTDQRLKDLYWPKQK